MLMGGTTTNQARFVSNYLNCRLTHRGYSRIRISALPV